MSTRVRRSAQITEKLLDLYDLPAESALDTMVVAEQWRADGSAAIVMLGTEKFIDIVYLWMGLDGEVYYSYDFRQSLSPDEARRHREVDLMRQVFTAMVNRLW